MMGLHIHFHTLNGLYGNVLQQNCTPINPGIGKLIDITNKISTPPNSRSFFKNFYWYYLRKLQQRHTVSKQDWWYDRFVWRFSRLPKTPFLRMRIAKCLTGWRFSRYTCLSKQFRWSAHLSFTNRLVWLHFELYITDNNSTCNYFVYFWPSYIGLFIHSTDRNIFKLIVRMKRARAHTASGGTFQWAKARTQKVVSQD